MLSKLRVLLVWLTLLFFLLITGHGIYSHGLLKQHFWSVLGLHRLGFVALVYSVWWLALIAFLPKWSAVVTTGAIVVFVAAALGPCSLAAVLFFVFSCYVLGSSLLPGSTAPGLPEKVLRFLLGLSIWMAVFGTMAHFPINYPVVYAVLLLAPIAARPRLALGCLRDCAHVIRPLRAPARGDCLMLALACFPLLCHLLAILQPEEGVDALAAHLMVPAWVDFQHLWPFDFTHIAWAVTPLGADWCYTAVYLLGGEAATQLLNVSALVTIALLLYGVCERYTGRRSACLFVALFASTPLVLLVTGSLFIENLWAALLVGAAVAIGRFHETAEPRALYVSAVLVGAGMATKFGTFAFLAPLLPLAVWEIWQARNRLKNPLRSGGIAAFLLVVFGAPPYVFAYLKTGNPVFPFLNNVFKSPWYLVEPFVTNYSLPLSLSEPYGAVFQTHKYLESYDGALGFQYLLFLALCAVLLRRKSPYFAFVALGISVVFCVLMFSGQAYVRYLYPVLPLFTFAAAVAVNHIATNKFLSRAVFATLLAVLGLNIYFLPSSGELHRGFFLNVFDNSEVTKHVTEANPVRRIVAQLNKAHPGEPVAFYETSQIAGLRAKAYVYGWHNTRYVLKSWLSHNAVDYGRYMQSLGVKYFVVPVSWDSPVAFTPARTFINRYTHSEYRVGIFELRRLNADAPEKLAERRHEPAPLPPCDPAMIDDHAPAVRYSGKWRRVEKFGQACNETLSYAEDRNSEASFQFTGTSVTYVYTKAYTRGRAEFTIDGVKREVPEFFLPEIQWRSQVVFDNLPRGRHTLKIRVLHEKAEESQSCAVDIDGFVVR